MKETVLKHAIKRLVLREIIKTPCGLKMVIVFKGL
jgi:hypothetical protein